MTMKVRIKVLSSLFISLIHPRVAGGGVYKVHAHATHLKCMEAKEKEKRKMKIKNLAGKSGRNRVERKQVEEKEKEMRKEDSVKGKRNEEKRS